MHVRAAESGWSPSEAGGADGGGADPAEAMFVARSIAADHKDLIHDVSFDFHGRRMATCSSDQSVKVRAEPSGEAEPGRREVGARVEGPARGEGTTAATEARCLALGLEPKGCRQAPAEWLALPFSLPHCGVTGASGGCAAALLRRAGGEGGHRGHVRAAAAGDPGNPPEFPRTQARVLGGSQGASSP